MKKENIELKREDIDMLNIIKKVFNSINNNDWNELQNFYNELIENPLFKKNAIPLKDIDFTINKEDLQSIKTFIQNNFSSNDGSYKKQNGEDWTPLEKLFFSVLWKNNQVTRFKHLIDGIKNELERSEKMNNTPNEYNGDNIPGADNDYFESNFVFKQFGRFLVNPNCIPIVDQHVLRAFLYYKITDNVEKNVNLKLDFQDRETLHQYLDIIIEDTEELTLRKLQIEALSNTLKLNKNKKNSYYKLYKEYLKWYNKLNLNCKEYNRLIDKTLFLIGKTLNKDKNGRNNR